MGGARVAVNRRQAVPAEQRDQADQQVVAPRRDDRPPGNNAAGGAPNRPAQPGKEVFV